MCQAVGEVVAAGANSLHKTGTPVMYMQYGAFSDYKVCIGYPPTKSEGYSFGCVRPSVHSVRPSVRPEPYLSTYWSDLIHSWYK